MSPASRKTVSIIAGILLITLLIGFYQIRVSNRLVLGGNEGSHLSLIYSIVNKSTFKLFDLPIPLDASQFNGYIYSNKPPGYPFLISVPCFLITKLKPGEELPVYVIFMVMKISCIFFFSLTATCIYLFLRTYNLRSTSIFFGLSASILGTIYPAYNCLANSFPLTILLIAASLLFCRYAQIKKHNYIFWTLTFSAISYAFIVEYQSLFFLSPLIFFSFVNIKKTNSRITILMILLPSLLPLFLIMFYNYKVFGTPFALTYSYYVPPDYLPWDNIQSVFSIKDIPHGLWGLVLSPSRGLFLISPVVLLGIINSWSFIKEKQYYLFLLIIMAFAGALFLSSHKIWHGAHCVGYRYILPGAMILGILSSFFIERIRKVKGMLFAFTLLVFSMFTGIASFYIQLNEKLLAITWKAEPLDIHANFFTELLLPLLIKNC
jgi:hypothetical protein